MRVLNRKETVTFKNEFRLRYLGQTFPAGQYTIETIDEILEGMSFFSVSTSAYHNSSTKSRHS